MDAPGRDRFLGALLGAVVGDGLGAPFEGTSGPIASDAWTAVESADHALVLTDDSAMTLAVAESLVQCEGLDEEDLAARFAVQWAEQPDAGYSRRTSAILERIRAGIPWSDAQHDIGRPSNGAAMRVAPIALFAAGAPHVARRLAERSALVTHRHPGAIAGAWAQTAAVLTALGHPTGASIEVSGFIRSVCQATEDASLEARIMTAGNLASRGDPVEIGETLGAGLMAEESVPAAICAFVAHPASFVDAVSLAVRLGSDTDTVASMTGALSGALLGAGAIPERWLARIPEPARIHDLADALHALAAARSTSPRHGDRPDER